MNKSIEKYFNIMREHKHSIPSTFEFDKSEMIEITYKGVVYSGKSIYSIGMTVMMCMRLLNNKTNFQAELMEFIDYCNLRDTVIKRVKK